MTAPNNKSPPLRPNSSKYQFFQNLKKHAMRTLISIKALLLFIILYSCKKQDTPIGNYDNVKHYLQKQQEGISAKRKLKIAQILASAEWNKSWIEEMPGDKYVELIPLGKNLNFVNQASLPVQNYLAVYMDNRTKSIDKILVVQYDGKDPDIKRLQVFKNLYFNRKVTGDYTITFLSIYDLFQYQFVYKDGKKTMGVVEGKQVSNQRGGCMDWFLIHIAPDGTITMTFLFRTCNQCYSGTATTIVFTDCDDPIPGGGTTGPNTPWPGPPQTEEVYRRFEWTIPSADLSSSTVDIRVTTDFYGNRQSGVFTGGNFSGIYHVKSEAISYLPPSTPVTWSEQTNSITTSYSGGYASYGNLSGNLTVDQIETPIQTAMGWMFFQVFP
ncbi:MAG: hypothetical protein EAZ47_05235 [Bacteroidetes bacterium]|nr:MAG: hypothetical protein EAY72_03370 [Bacteroidota bacterium]TAF93917.1 MAG: hypothetical protein EAZ47_05235 [Bacteroidota bacterium]